MVVLTPKLGPGFFGKQLTLQTLSKDKYGRTIADVFLPDGININHELVRRGWFLLVSKVCAGGTILESLETKHERARKACGLTRILCRRGSGGSAGNCRMPEGVPRACICQRRMCLSLSEWKRIR